jgi:hypothetical protein
MQRKTKKVNGEFIHKDYDGANTKTTECRGQKEEVLFLKKIIIII